MNDPRIKTRASKVYEKQFYFPNPETVIIGSLSVLVQHRRGQQSRTWSWIVHLCLYAYPRELWPLKDKAT
ncbi:hypothetical protein NPIL_533301, partial [Nephila pilipes]